jgi:hypothetical protein
MAADILAKASEGSCCAAVVNTHGGDETDPYSTIVEFFARDEDGQWYSLGHHGPSGLPMAAAQDAAVRRCGTGIAALADPP